MHTSGNAVAQTRLLDLAPTLELTLFPSLNISKSVLILKTALASGVLLSCKVLKKIYMEYTTGTVPEQR